MQFSKTDDEKLADAERRAAAAELACADAERRAAAAELTEEGQMAAAYRTRRLAELEAAPQVHGKPRPARPALEQQVERELQLAILRYRSRGGAAATGRRGLT